VPQLIKDIRIGDFKETCRDFANPAGAVSYHRWLYEPIIGKKCVPLVRDDSMEAFQIEKFSPQPRVEIVQCDCWVGDKGEYGHYTAWEGETWEEMKRRTLEYETRDYNWRQTSNGRRATTEEEKRTFGKVLNEFKTTCRGEIQPAQGKS